MRWETAACESLRQQRVLKCPPHILIAQAPLLLLLLASEESNIPTASWLDVSCYVSTHSPCAMPPLFTLCHSLMSVSQQRGGGQMAQGAGASQLWHFSWSTLAPPQGGSDEVRTREERRRKKERRSSLWDKLWLDVSESNRWVEFERCSSSLILDVAYDRPHTEILLAYPITSFDFGFMLCRSCHNSGMTRQQQTQTLWSLNKPRSSSFPSSLHILSRVSNRAEPFHKLVNSGGERKVTRLSAPNWPWINLQTFGADWDGAVRHRSSVESWRFAAATFSSAIRRESWCFWDWVWWDRTSCADLVIALLQRHACFDLTHLVFREQILPFCSPE